MEVGLESTRGMGGRRRRRTLHLRPESRISRNIFREGSCGTCKEAMSRRTGRAASWLNRKRILALHRMFRFHLILGLCSDTFYCTLAGGPSCEHSHLETWTGNDATQFDTSCNGNPWFDLVWHQWRVRSVGVLASCMGLRFLHAESVVFRVWEGDGMTPAGTGAETSQVLRQVCLASPATMATLFCFTEGHFAYWALCTMAMTTCSLFLPACMVQFFRKTHFGCWAPCTWLQRPQGQCNADACESHEQ